MGPPPTPIDPNLEALNASPAPNIGLDPLFPTISGSQQRPLYPREITIATGYFQEGQTASMRPTHLDLSPSLNSHPDPWDSQRVGGGIPQHQLMNQNYLGARDRSYHPGQAAYWEPASDVDSSNGRHVPDSGYYTQTRTGSIYSEDVVSNQECQSLPGGMNEAELRGSHVRLDTMYSTETSIKCSEEQAQASALELTCQVCQQKSKNRSELTYVYIAPSFEILLSRFVANISFAMKSLSSVMSKVVAG